MPQCWKCTEAIRKVWSEAKSSRFEDQLMVGCDICDDIISYGDAETMCPKRGVDTETLCDTMSVLKQQVKNRE